MKKYKLVLIAVLFALASPISCNDEEFLDVKPVGDVESAYFQNEDQMTAGVIGIYQKLNDFYRWDRQDYLTRIDLLPSDDITVVQNFPHENFSALTPSNTHSNRAYKKAYQLIGRANIVLQKIEENGDFAYESDSPLKNYHKGEALFLKSLMNFKLWNWFGTAPLVNKRFTLISEAYPPNSTGTELLDQAVTDLTEAITLLPESWPEDQLGRATKNSARGLLLKTLVFRGTVNGTQSDFSTAISTFNTITADLAPIYTDNFDLTKENNIESLFEYQANRQVGRVNAWLNNNRGNDQFATIGDISAYYGFYTNNQSGGTFIATNSLINTFTPGDPRLTLGFVENPTANDKNILKYISTDVLIPGGQVANPGGVLSENNTRILRYADAILLAAEAYVRANGAGGIDAAMALVNRVRERARNSVSPASEVPADYAGETFPGTPSEALELIFKERRMELFAEEAHRWQDLRRRHLAGEIDLTNWDFSSRNGDFDFKEYNIYFPLPFREVLDNPNLNGTPGYNY